MMASTSPLKVGLTDMFLITISVLLFSYLSVFYDAIPTLAAKSQIGMSLLIAGLVMSVLFVGVQVEGAFLPGWKQNLLWFGVAIASLLLGSAVLGRFNFGTTIAVPPEVSIAFGLQMAVAEEVFFRGFLASFFSRYVFRGGLIIGAFMSALVWTVYHFYVYGTSVATLAFVFVVGLGWGIAFLGSGKSLWITMVAHALQNLRAGLGG